MVEVNFGHIQPETVAGLRRVDELKEWEGSRIGAGVTWRRIESDGPKALAEAARTVGSPQIRNAGTIGGNLGTASPAGDGHPFLAAVDASIELVSLNSTRTLDWSEFFVGVKKTARLAFLRDLLDSFSYKGKSAKRVAPDRRQVFPWPPESGKAGLLSR